MTRQENVFNLISPAFVSARFFCCGVVACSEEEEASEGLGCELRCRDGRKIFKLLAATLRFMMVKYGKGNRSRCTRFSVMNNWELFVSVEIRSRKLERSQLYQFTNVKFKLLLIKTNQAREELPLSPRKTN